VSRAQRRTWRGALALASTLGFVFALSSSCRSTSVPPPRSPADPGSQARATPPPPAPGLPGDDLVRLAPAPSVRIGVITGARRISVGSDAGVVVWGQDAEGRWTGRRAEVARATFVAVVPEGAVLPAGLPRFRVQVGSFTDEAGARTVASRVESTVRLPSVVGRFSESGRYQVRVGEFTSREEAQGKATELHRAGFPGSFVTEDAKAIPAGKVRLLESGDEFVRAVALPVGAGRLDADGTAYRGALEVRPGASGLLTLVNLVGREDYLMGVVPNELSPQAFPEIEALKAQAVAARTYVEKNRGQFAAQGYDICATPACQVYKGASSESDLSSRAVRETGGIVASYGGAPINALYTSTCGGHTEDGGNVFDDGPPYLRGVVCAPERASLAALRTSVVPRALDDDADLTRGTALLVALGVVEPRLYTASVRKGIPTDGEIRAWTGRLTGTLRRKGCDPSVDASLARRGNFFQYLVGTLCWDERGARLLAPGDPAYLLALEDKGALTREGERQAAALLLSEGIVSPFPDNTLRPGTALTRAQVVVLLTRAAERAGLPDLVSASFQKIDGSGLELLHGEEREHHPVDPALRLFRNLDGAVAAASEVALTVGDDVRYVVRDGRIVFLEVVQARKGASADRDSRYYRWEVRLTPAAVADGVARYGKVGTVRDLEPRRIGVSGRVVELVVRGSDGDLLLRGLKVRWGLGLRENLFVIDRERDAKGTIERFVFTGKGWGHGVGLCQVGAFGMAQAGANYEQILKHYYSGIALQGLD
jgi:stage II sporulation protein D